MLVHLAPYGPSGGSLVARFEYHPTIVEALRAIPGRQFDDKLGVWTFPALPDNVLALHEKARAIGWRLSLPADLRAALRSKADAAAEAMAIRAAGDAEIDYPFVTPPYAHQRAGLAFLARMGSAALLWEMGLGKSKTAIDYAEWLATRGPRSISVLVIAPKTVCGNWAAEVEKHAGHKDYALLADGALTTRAKGLGIARYSIVNAEALSHKPMADALRKITWDLVICDESTRFKSPKAARTKALLKLTARHRVILTGTPITGSPEDAWAQFQFVAPGLLGQSYWAFRDRYLAVDFFRNVTGLKKETGPELIERIDSRSYRILKGQVLDLPPKVYTDRRVTLAGDQARAYAQMRDELRVEIENTPAITAASILTLLLRLTQITAGLVGSGTDYRWLPDAAKAVEMDALVNEELAGEQVVVFGIYQRELEELAKRYGYADAPPILYGPTAAPRRTEIIEAFQAGNLRMIFAQPRTGGLGINLTRAQTALYHTRSWSLEEWLQSQDRLHRIGQKGTVSIVTLTAAGTVDEQIAKALHEKATLADRMTGDAARRLAKEVLL